MWRSLVITCLLVLAAVGGWFGRGWLGESQRRAPGTEAGETVRVARERMVQSVKARGIVKPAPNALVRVGFPMPKDVARRISRLPFVEGDEVKAGQELAVLDHEDLTASLEQLKAEAAVFQRRLEGLRLLEPLEVRQAEAVREERKAQLDHAKSTQERLFAAASRSAASAQALETATNDLAAAQAKFEQVTVNVDQVRAKFRSDIATLEAQLEQAKAAIQNIEVQVRWSTIYAPFDARVFAIHQHQGELTSNLPSNPVMTLLDPKQLQLHVYVDEADFGRIQLGQSVTFRLDAHPDRMLNGQIIRLLPQPILQENVVYYLAVVEVEEEQRSLLRSDMTALVHVEAGEKEAALTLPLAAVHSRPDGWYVMRRGPAGPVDTPVRVGWRDEGRVEIIEGLSEGEEVMLE
ncbi:MAG: HlyD family efflux transporter periplasmic adaptor subunit [Planctomycetes bacterium]|nr:HlyD family efflux transporter periplasmic adaptor subunit [Planctomycetota bacterium]